VLHVFPPPHVSVRSVGQARWLPTDPAAAKSGWEEFLRQRVTTIAGGR
jgi:hypothetical protein